MTDFRMPDSYYDPPDYDEDEDREDCESDCILESDHRGSCYTREDRAADEAEARRDAERDRWYDDDAVNHVGGFSDD